MNQQLAEYTRELATFTWWLVAATVGLAAVAIIQLASALYTSVKQMRAYVVVATADILNVAPCCPLLLKAIRQIEWRGGIQRSLPGMGCRASEHTRVQPNLDAAGRDFGDVLS